ncbi:hypothetical protein GCM10011414_00770 [Croceivirga lutea]|uniref:hypothetical protein n=1 Tax=Croceivirga lutea TaxID=1775167 RepID=UPI00163A5ECF|nr:hypothetical protein [Croceivirga lutea]GGG35207.1 hypothetical protein GCM10011414_00770 [Croceivirga lutea]
MAYVYKPDFQKQWTNLYLQSNSFSTLQSKSFILTWYANYSEEFKPIVSFSLLGNKIVGLLFLAQHRTKKHIIHAGANEAEYHGWLAVPEFSSKAIFAYHSAELDYKITPQDIIVDVFKAGDTVQYVHEPKFLGWKKVGVKNIRVHEVRGNQNTMFLRPNVEDFGRKLQYQLDNYDAITD